ncbi:hypothetical protein V6Z12_A13G232200 [Gossypium hirsutum]
MIDGVLFAESFTLEIVNNVLSIVKDVSELPHTETQLFILVLLPLGIQEHSFNADHGVLQLFQIGFDIKRQANFVYSETDNFLDNPFCNIEQKRFRHKCRGKQGNQ